MSGYPLDPKFDGAKVIYINSLNATHYMEKNDFGDFMTTNFLFNLKEKLVVEHNQSALISLYNATIPHSFFNVRDGVNDRVPIKVIYTDTLGVSYTDQHIIQLDDGNYDSNQLIRQFIHGNTPIQPVPAGTFPLLGFQEIKYQGFNDLLQLQGNEAGKRLTDLCELVVRYNDVNNVFRWQLNFKGAANQNIEIILNWATCPVIGSDFNNGETKKLANALYGFRGNTDYPNAPTQVFPNNPSGTSLFFVDNITKSRVLQGQQVIDLNNNIHGLMLRTSLVSKSTMSSAGAVFSNILGRIPINSIQSSGVDAGGKSGVAHQGGIIYFNPNGATHQSLVDLKAIDRLGVRLTDDNDTTIDLNGLNFQFAILIQYVDKQPVLRHAPSRQNIDDELKANAEPLIPKQQLKIKKKKKTQN